jgi:DNA replication protein DnaC
MVFLEELLSARYNNMLKNIIISNLNTKELREHLGDRLSSRLREGILRRIIFSGEDLRRVYCENRKPP